MTTTHQTTISGAPAACVIGHPIHHSRSPIIHNHWLRRHGLSGSYDARDVAPEAVPTFLDTIRLGGLAGCNVTVPLKEIAFANVDHVTPTATLIGAVNTLWMQDGRLMADNTDVYGFCANLDDHAPAWRNGTHAVVIGAGGAARAILKGLLDAGYTRIDLINRTVSRAEGLAHHFGPDRIFPAGFDALTSVLATADLIVNTSALGMDGADDVEIDFSTARTDALATDIVYVPLETGFLAAARRAGLTTVDGLGMLLHQAVPGFERWFGIRPAVDSDLRAVVEADLFGH